jgi:hypothetical protein
MSNPKSSLTPKLKVAEVPTIDHKTGIINKLNETFLSVQSRNPNVKMLVGQGSPNVGDAGKVRPRL